MPIQNTGSTITEVEFGRDTPPSKAVVEAVPAVTDREPIDLPPLFDAIDPSELDDFFVDPPADSYISFEYVGFLVGVHTNGFVSLAG